MTNRKSTTVHSAARSAIMRIEHFGSCSDRTLDKLAAEAEFKTFEDGAYLWRRGAPASSLCLTISGTIEISMTSSEGKRHVLYFVEAGQLINLIALLDGGAGIHDIIAHGDTIVLLIPRSIFLQAVAGEPLLAQAVMRIFCFRLRGLYDYIAENTLLPLRARCARLLLSFIDGHGMPNASGCAITLKLSQEDFADMLGRTRQSVNKELRQLERAGAIKMRYSGFAIVDQDRLREIATEKVGCF